MAEKLDNPVWYSLSEAHSQFALDFDGLLFYQPDFCPFGGFERLDNLHSGIDSYRSLTNNFYIVGEKPTFGNSVYLNKELICNQMFLENQKSVEIKEEIVPLHSPSQLKELFNLVNLVQPGYFRPKTANLGSYFGIYSNGKLVAVTGERMKMNDFTEVSAVVTHPEFTGKGFAKQLVTHTCNKVFAENKTPYLHVAETNTSAIQLYENLGFETRRKISFWNLVAK